MRYLRLTGRQRRLTWLVLAVLLTAGLFCAAVLHMRPIIVSLATARVSNAVNRIVVDAVRDAIDSGQVDVIDAFATDALLSKFDLVQLEDDASFFPPYYAVNFIRQECLDEYPELEEVLALLDGRISNEAMAAMNAEVDLEGRDAADVAHDFLVEEGLI